MKKNGGNPAIMPNCRPVMSTKKRKTQNNLFLLAAI